jgi:hypothetical protein
MLGAADRSYLQIIVGELSSSKQLIEGIPEGHYTASFGFHGMPFHYPSLSDPPMVIDIGEVPCDLVIDLAGMSAVRIGIEPESGRVEDELRLSFIANDSESPIYSSVFADDTYVVAGFVAGRGRVTCSPSEGPAKYAQVELTPGALSVVEVH